MYAKDETSKIIATVVIVLMFSCAGCKLYDPDNISLLRDTLEQKLGEDAQYAKFKNLKYTIFEEGYVKMYSWGGDISYKRSDGTYSEYGPFVVMIDKDKKEVFITVFDLELEELMKKIDEF